MERENIRSKIKQIRPHLWRILEEKVSKEVMYDVYGPIYLLLQRSVMFRKEINETLVDKAETHRLLLILLTNPQWKQ